MEAIVLERITELLKWRKWYRARPDWGNFLGLAREHEVELRALLKLARQARREFRDHPADATLEQADPITAYKGWSESEMRAAVGDR